MKNLFCLLFTIFSLSLLSQTDSLVVKKNLNLGGNYTAGNFNFYSLNIKPEIIAENKRNQLSVNSSFQYSQVQNTNQVYKIREREFYNSINYTRRFNEWRLIFFNESEQSFLRKIDLRGSLGLGLGHKLVKNSNLEIDLSQLFLPEYLLSNFGDEFNNFALRSSTRLKFVYKKNSIKFSSIGFFQPSLYTVKNNGKIIDFKDNINGRLNTSLEYLLKKGVSVGVNDQVVYQTYSSSINSSIKPLDHTLTFFLKLSL